MRLVKIAVMLGIAIMMMVACGGEDGGGDSAESGGGSSSSAVTTTRRPSGNPTLPPERPLSTPTQPASRAERSTVTVVQGVGDLEQVDVWIDGNIAARAIEPFETTRPIDLAVGIHQLQVTETMARGRAEEGEIYLEQTLEVESDQPLILVLGRDGGQVYLAGYMALVEPLEPGEARLVLVNGVTDGLLVRVETGGTVLVDALAMDTNSSPLTLAADQSQTIDFFDGNLLLGSVEVDARNGMVYTVVLVGDTESDQFVPLMVDHETVPQSSVRIIHASPDAPPLRVMFGEDEAADDLVFGAAQDFQTWPSGVYTIQLLEGDEVLQKAEVALPAHRILEMVIYGYDTDMQITTYPVDTSPIPPESTRLTVIHAVPDEGRIYVLGPTDDVDYDLSVSYGRADSTVLALEAAEFRFMTGNLDAPLIIEAPLNPVIFERDRAYVYVVTGRSAENPVILSLDVDVEEDAGTGDQTILQGEVVQVRALNLLADPIQVTLGDERITAGLAPDTLSATVDIAPDFYVMRLYSAAGELLHQQDMRLPEGVQIFTIYVLTNNQVVGIPDTPAPPSDASVLLRFIHAAAGYPMLVVDTEANYDLDTVLGYGEVGATVRLPVDQIDFTVQERETLHQVAEFPTPGFRGGYSYVGVLVRGADGSLLLKWIEYRDGA